MSSWTTFFQILLKHFAWIEEVQERKFLWLKLLYSYSAHPLKYYDLSFSLNFSITFEFIFEVRTLTNLHQERITKNDLCIGFSQLNRSSTLNRSRKVQILSLESNLLWSLHIFTFTFSDKSCSLFLCLIAGTIEMLLHLHFRGLGIGHVFSFWYLANCYFSSSIYL